MKATPGGRKPKSGGKKDLLFDRPLIPCLISFAGGIITAHAAFPDDHVFGLSMLLIISVCLLASLFCPEHVRAYLPLAVFFLTGVLLTPEKQPPSRLRLPAMHHQKAVMEGVILEPCKRSRSGMVRMKVLAQGLVRGNEMLPLNEKIIVTAYGNAIPLPPGEKIRFPARLKTFKNFQNPGHYDYEEAMTLKGFTCAAAVSDGRRIVPMGPGALPFSRRWIERLQAPVRAFFKASLDHRNRALFSALILGERQGIDRSLREIFNRAGLGHLLAVSGLHIGLAAWTVFFIFKFGFSRSYRRLLATDVRKWCAFFTCFPVIAYTLLAGWHISAQRAMIMVLAYLVSLMLGKEKEVWSTLALAGLIILFLDPGAIFTPSFQLSFLAVIGILWLAPAVLNKLGHERYAATHEKALSRPILRYFTALTAVSISAFYFLLPITAFYFHRIPLVSIPANLTTIPILGLWVLPLGLLSVLTLPLSSHAAVFFLHGSTWGLDIMMNIVRFWSDLPSASIRTVTPNLFEISLFYVFTFFAFFAGRLKWAKFALAAALLCIMADAAFWIHRVRFNRNLEVIFLDVGKGNAALVSFPGGKKMMIDGGGFPGDYFDVGKMVVAPLLWRRKVLTVDYLVLSHPQADHMNGLRFIAAAFHPKEFWHNGDPVETRSYKNLMRTLESRRILKKRPVHLRGKIRINGAEVEVLYPGPDKKQGVMETDGKRLNNRSMVLKISFGGTSILFPGDLEETGEKKLLAHAGDRIKSDILLSPHHGSRTSSSEAFLKMVAPRLCVISSGEDRFGRFPHPEILNRLDRMGCEIIQINRSGAVTIKVRPDGFDVDPFVPGVLMKN